MAVARDLRIAYCCSLLEEEERILRWVDEALDNMDPLRQADAGFAEQLHNRLAALRRSAIGLFNFAQETVTRLGSQPARAAMEIERAERRLEEAQRALRMTRDNNVSQASLDSSMRAAGAVSSGVPPAPTFCWPPPLRPVPVTQPGYADDEREVGLRRNRRQAERFARLQIAAGRWSPERAEEYLEQWDEPEPVGSRPFGPSEW